MARPWRIEFPGACYHVLNRGNYRRNLFQGEGAAEAFVRTLDEAAERFGWRVSAYVVMRNHFHLAVELTEPNLSVGMKWLQGTWIRRYNGFRGLTGRPFQGRYKALLVEPGAGYGRVCHYVHLNPVRAGVVAPDQVADYPWSSLPRFLGRGRPAWLEPGVVLDSAGGLRDTAKGWRSYLGYLEFLATDRQEQRTLVAAKMSRGWRLGGVEFRKEMRAEAVKRGAELDRAGLTGLEPASRREEREAAWEERLGALARAAKIDLGALPPAKSHPAKVLLAAALKRRSAVPNGWLATRLRMGQPASASQFVRRLLLSPAGPAAVTRLLSKVKT